MDSGKSSVQQQFCLRWHNHQASLLSSLPLLLDQAHLTDVTLSAEGKTLQAHRVVLSACSTFFSELFRTLDPSQHPVIVIPGSTFGTLVALLTFMYSGEVNVFEEQIQTLLVVAETLGIKGLADFHNNLQNTTKFSRADDISTRSKAKTYYPQVSTPKKKNTLENFFIRSFQLYPSLMPEPLNFSQSALNKTADFLENYQQQCNLMQKSTKNSNNENKIIDGNEDSNKDIFSGVSNIFDKDPKIDDLVEHMRNAETDCKDTYNRKYKSQTSLTFQHPPLEHNSTNPGEKNTKKLYFKAAPENNDPFFCFGVSQTTPDAPPLLEKTVSNSQPKTSNTKLYATCFICHKQLSNQYNLRVHLETHQNVRYACSVCSHVSRSKDALRKHVSYRHPGVCSTGESESRRKRSKASQSNFSSEQVIIPELIGEQIPDSQNISDVGPVIK